MTPEQIKDYLIKGGIIGILGFALFAGYSGMFVWGSEYRDLRAERDSWRKLALSGTNLSKEAISILDPTPKPMMAQRPSTVNPSFVTPESIANEQQRIQENLRSIKENAEFR